MLRRLYDWTVTLAESRNALWALGILAFFESSIFPIPVEAMMLPMLVAVPKRAFLIAAIATVGSVLGGAFGYVIGAGLYESVGKPVLTLYGYDAKFDDFRAAYAEYGAWAVFIAGLTPIPYKVATILSGAASLNFLVFMVASILARGLKFFIIAALLWKFGPAIREFIEKRLGLVTALFMILFVGGFVAAKYLL